ncbi:MAG TPA: radical SAM protein [Methylomirabilota bacterium]|nr:radical SAM protein [Methylomirabilota bacterium]
MIDVLLAHSYFLKYDPKQVDKMRPYPPLATLYAASALREAGYSVALFDAMLSDGEHEFDEAVRRHRPRFVALYEDSFNFLVKMCLSRMRRAAQRMSEIARENGAVVIAAGPDVTDNPDVYFPHGVQYALIGEADRTLRDLIDILDRRVTRPLDELDGLALPDPAAPAGVRRTRPRTPERRPDSFRFPAWDLVDVERYRAAWRQAHGYFSLSMVSTRGCPFHCNWCAKPVWGQRYAMRSAANVAEELDLVKRTLRPDHIWFADDIFGLRPQWVADFAREVQARDAAVPFMIQSRADLMTEQAITGLAAAGCVEVWLGAESGSQRILDAMDKGITVGQIVTARTRLKAAGIKVGYFLQFGYPGEDFQDILATVQLVRDTLPDRIGVSVSYPLPGTKFHQMVKDQLGPKTNWVDSNDLAMMFRGTYETTFYRRLHRLLHADLELRLASANGPPDVATRAALSGLDEEWTELAETEAQYRNVSPTLIAKDAALPVAPDLSREWN